MDGATTFVTMAYILFGNGAIRPHLQGYPQVPGEAPAPQRYQILPVL